MHVVAATVGGVGGVGGVGVGGGGGVLWAHVECGGALRWLVDYDRDQRLECAQLTAHAPNVGFAAVASL